MIFRLIAVIFILVSLGCASSGPKYKKVSEFDGDKALIYMYRVKRFGGSFGSPYVCLDDKVVGETVNGEYFPLLVEPGNHKIGLSVNNAQSSTLYFNVKAGETYYLRFSAPMNNGAIESAHAGRRAGLPNGGGALGAGLTSALGPNANEKQQILDQLDKRAQKFSLNPGLLFVSPGFGKKEIQESNLFAIPSYKKNYCAN